MNIQNVTFLYTNILAFDSLANLACNTFWTVDIYTHHVYNIGDCLVAQDSTQISFQGLLSLSIQQDESTFYIKMAAANDTKVIQEANIRIQ